jgi:dephospho-CoA kinase
MLIGITGSICSGKDTLAKMLVGKYGFKSYSLVEILRNEHDRVRKSIDSRQNRRDFANERRDSHGAHYLVSEAFRQATSDGLTKEDNIVFVGLYCEGEVDYFINTLGGILLGVVCNEDLGKRHDRYLSRRESDSSPLTLEEFEMVVQLESGGNSPKETNVAKSLTYAQRMFNNDHDFEHLQSQLDDYAKEIGLDASDDDFAVTVVESYDPTYLHNLNLQTDYEIFSYLRNHFSIEGFPDEDRMLAPVLRPAHCVRELSNQFGKKIVQPFLCTDVDQAWEEFRKIQASTTDEEMVMLTNRREFGELHSEIRRYLADNSKKIEIQVMTNLERIKKHDLNQFRPEMDRSLKRMREEGLKIRILPEFFAQIADLQLKYRNSMVPLTEILKNERIAEMTFIGRSKVSTLIHDTIDHVWLYSLLADKGILAKFGQMFNAIGNPDKFDIYMRESEIVASIGYGVRYYANVEVGFKPKVLIEEIAARLEEFFDTNVLEDRHMDAYRHIRLLAGSPTLRESQSLAYVFSNYLVELDEQRRKHGRINYRNEDMEIIGELDPWSADFLCFVIETHRLLLDSKNKHRDNLLRAHLILEQHLCSPEAIKDGNSLTIDGDDLDKFDLSEISLPPERVMWMARNYGFTAIRDRSYSA